MKQISIPSSRNWQVWSISIVAAISVGLVVISIIVADRMPRRAEPSRTQRGQGPSDAEALLTTWADRLVTGDYAAVSDLTTQGDGWTFDLLQDRAEQQRDRGRMQGYSLTRVEPTGSSTNAVIHFVTGDTRGMCLPVQVGNDGKVNVTSDFRWCRDGE